MKSEDRCPKTLPSSYLISDHGLPGNSSTFTAEKKSPCLSFVASSKKGYFDAMPIGGTCAACQ
jgi:hypothetical protein